MKTSAALLCIFLFSLPPVAGAQPKNPQLSDQLAGGVPDSWSYRNPKVDVARYKTFIIEPTVVSTDPAGNWGKATEADKQKYAGLFTHALREEIGKSYGLATKKGPGVAIMRITLLGVTPTSPVAIATRVTPVGLALTSVKSLRGKPGTFSGSAQVAFELTDSQSGELIAGVIRRRSPDALDIVSTTSTENTISSIAKEAAEAIRAALDKAHGRPPPG